MESGFQILKIGIFHITNFNRIFNFLNSLITKIEFMVSINVKTCKILVTIIDPISTQGNDCVTKYRTKGKYCNIF